jgi:hypothetical protein
MFEPESVPPRDTGVGVRRERELSRGEVDALDAQVVLALGFGGDDPTGEHDGGRGGRGDRRGTEDRHPAEDRGDGTDGALES